MKQLFLIILFAATCLGATAANVSGNVTGSHIWTLANSPYVVTGSVNIAQGATLTIENGVEVRFADGCNLTNNGTLNANNVSFTSNTGTTPGKWQGLCLNAGSTSNLTDISVKHAEYPLRMDNGVCVLNINGNNTFEANTHEGASWYFATVNADFTLPELPIPWLLTNHKNITNNAKLTIEAGVTIKCNNGTYIEVSNGSMQAIGTAEEPILITSREDTESGGRWRGLFFKSGSVDDNKLVYCTIRYGSHNEHLGWGSYSNPRRISLQVATNTGLTMTNCILEKTPYGIHIEDNATVEMTGCTINGTEYPIVMRADGILDVVDCNLNFTNTQNKAILLENNNYELKANSQLKVHSFTNAPAIAYRMGGTLIVPEGKTLTIDPGVVLKGESGSDCIRVRGKLVAEGTAENPIVFTSIHDDSHGGDSNNNGVATSPSLGQVGGIVLHAEADNTSSVKHVLFRYANCGHTFTWLGEVVPTNAAVTCFDSSPTIENCTFFECNYGVKALGNSTVTIKNNAFENIKYTPIAINASAAPVLQNNTWGDNIKYRAIGLLGQKTGHNGAIRCLNDFGHENLTYLLLSDWTITQGTQVTIDPGVVIKVWDNKWIAVRGGLNIAGTADKRVVFTEMRDDNYGTPADTESDGSNSVPTANRWNGIYFYNYSDADFSKVTYADFRYAGSGDGRSDYTYNSGISPLSNGSNLHNVGSAALVFSRTAIDVSNTNIFACKNGIAYWGAEATGKATNVKIENSSNCPITKTWNAQPQLTNVQFVNNANQAIGLQDWKIDYNVTLAKTAGITGSNTTTNAVYMSWNTFIPAGITVQADPGIIIKNSGFLVEGTLKLNGTAAEHITLTSIHDDSKGGDTNNNGNNTSPGKGNWNYNYYGVLFNNTLGDNLLKFTDIAYSNNGVCFRNSKATIEDSNIEQCSEKGVSIEGTTSNATIRRTAFNNLQVPIRKHAFATATLHEGNTASNVSIMGIELIGETFTTSGTLPLYNFAGHPDISYWITGTLTVESGVTLTVPAGTSFKRNQDGFLYNCFHVKGALNIEGTAEKPVVLTDQRDDNYGSPLDFNQDGTVTQNYNRYNHSHIYFQAGSGGNIAHLILKSNGYGVVIDGASPTIRNTRFEHLGRGISMMGISSAPVIENSLFHNAEYPLETSLLCFPALLTGNTFTGSSFRGIKVREETLNQNAILAPRAFGELTNAPYIFDNYIVDAELTIQPGAICKFNNGKGMAVNRWLKAIGTAERPIVFTSIHDDFYGGDTNADSTATAATASHWNGITFADATIDADCKLKYAIVKNAHEAITTHSASPTLEYVTFYTNRNAVQANAASNPVITNCDFVGMSQRAVNNVNKSFVIQATDCWWGSNEGPVVAASPSGRRQAVSESVNTAPYEPNGLNQPLLGDVSGNGSLQAYDASLVLQKAVGSITLEPQQERAADVSGDNQITAYDATMILEYVAGLRPNMPGGLRAPANNEVQLQIGSAEIYADEDILLPISLAGISSSVGVDLEINYDSNLLQAVEMLPAQGTNFMQEVRIDNRQGRIYIAAASTDCQPSEEWNMIRFRLASQSSSNFQTEITANLLRVNDIDKTEEVVSGTVIFGTTTGVDNATDNTEILCMPNPATDNLYIMVTGNNVKIRIYNMLGLEILNDDFDGNSINVSTLESGMYVLEIEYDGKVRRTRFFKQ